jgi:F0F1-type ATP synthase membrane subunit b/b'
MTLHATAVEILIEKGRFEPEVALGIAEAIEVSVVQSQFVTVPILDARLHELRAELKSEISSLRAELKGEISSLRSELKGEISSFKSELKGEMDSFKFEIRGEMKALKADVKAEIHAFKAELVRWVFVAMLGSVALSIAAQSLTNTFLR